LTKKTREKNEKEERLSSKVEEAIERLIGEGVGLHHYHYVVI